MKRVDKIDDKFFKKIFANAKNARDFLKKVLPVEIKKRLDFSAIDIENTNYISNEFKEGYSDIVVKAILKSKRGGKIPVDIYFIIEHKSESDKAVFIQILKYMNFVWEKDIINKKNLRIIIPVVFYHGKQKWNLPETFVDQFDVDDEFKQFMLNYRYVLFDTNQWNLRDESNRELRENVFLFSAMALMKASFKNDLDTIREILNLWHEKGFIKEKNIVLFFLIYISQTHNISINLLDKMLEESKIQGGDIMQTLAEQLKEEGIKIGEERGENRGMIKKAKETAKKMLEKDFDVDVIMEITGLDKKEIKNL